MNFAMTYANRYFHGTCILAFSLGLLACAGQPNDSRVQSTAEVTIGSRSSDATSDLHAWMKKENPEELPVLVPISSRVATPEGFVDLDSCARVSENLGAMAIHELVLDVLNSAEIMPIAFDGSLAPPPVSLAVTLRCTDVGYEYGIFVVHIAEGGGYLARPVSSGSLGLTLESDPSDVRNSLRHQLEVVVADYRTANSI